MEQDSVDILADTLDVKYGVIDNLKDGKFTYSARIILRNTGTVPLKHGDKWSIYFCHIRMIEPGILPDPNEVLLKEYGIKFVHVNGCLFRIESLKNFKTLNKNDTLEITFKGQHYSASRSDLMPNWYIIAEGCKPKIIKSTAHEDLRYVESFDEPCKWKRFDYVLDSGLKRQDKYDPWTPEKRFDQYKVENLKKPGKLVIPTPLKITFNDQTICLTEETWAICADHGLDNESNYLKGNLCGVNLRDSETKSEMKNVIYLKLNNGTITCNSKDLSSPEGYSLDVKPTQKVIEIIGNSSIGVFYGIQTLLSVIDDGKVPEISAIDSPRYSYRGMHIDVSRNFHSKEQILKLLDVMAMYKMNKFHFHLTDDEGWRVEIPGLEELTTVGSRRGHDLTEKTCILPMLGSGPFFDTSGSGHYSVEDYKEILTYAKDRHIEVIPEIDMPGHSHAAVKAMKARYYKYKEDGDLKAAEEYLLSDLSENGAAFTSVQMFSENSMNPGVESTYRFIDKVVSELKAIHKDINPLTTFHFGGDEVPYEAWEDSPACKKLIKSGEVKSFDELMEYFVKRVSEIVAKHDLNLGAWQDGVIHNEITLRPVKRSQFPTKEVYVCAWQNVWESGLSGCAYKCANSDYKVIMSQGTHLYFDHPYEPDPEERGLYWATRYIDCHKTFGFIPDNIYANADFKLSGDPITIHDLMKNVLDHEPLKEKENVIGIQGQLWTELVRTPVAFDEMIYPRLLALAERAWHKASWEMEQDDTVRKTEELADWTLFANSLGYKELQRLDNMGVTYHIPPPGARIVDGNLEVCAAYPGLDICYSTDEGITWKEIKSKEKISNSSIQLMCHSKSERRSSRVVTIKNCDSTKS